MFKLTKAWLTQSYRCRYCRGTGYESNLRMVRNQTWSWSFVALALVVLVIKFWPADQAPARPPLVRPAAPAAR